MVLQLKFHLIPRTTRHTDRAYEKVLIWLDFPILFTNLIHSETFYAKLMSNIIESELKQWKIIYPIKIAAIIRCLLII